MQENTTTLKVVLWCLRLLTCCNVCYISYVSPAWEYTEQGQILLPLHPALQADSERSNKDKLDFVAITSDFEIKATTVQIIGHFLSSFPPEVGILGLNHRRPRQSRWLPWMTRKNKGPQRLHAFTSTAESNVRKRLVFCSYWLVLRPQILWHLGSNPFVSWIPADFLCAAQVIGYKYHCCFTAFSESRVLPHLENVPQLVLM